MSNLYAPTNDQSAESAEAFALRAHFGDFAKKTIDEMLSAHREAIDAVHSCRQEFVRVTHMFGDPNGGPYRAAERNVRDAEKAVTHVEHQISKQFLGV